jgi:recombination protein RecA
VGYGLAGDAELESDAGLESDIELEVNIELEGDADGAQKEWRRAPLDAPLDAPGVNALEFDAKPGNASSRVERAGVPGADLTGAGRSRQESAWPASMGLLRNSALETGRASSAPSWGWREAAGRLCELAGGPASATLSCAASLALDAQLRGENVAWIQTRDSSFLPQDLNACGIDLDALVVVRLPRSTDLGLAAEWIARSGAFGLVVLDLTSVVHTPMAMQARLLALAKKHDLALVCLTAKNPQQASLSSLVSLRVDTTVRRPARARSTQHLGQAARHETSGEVAPTSGQERVATPELAADAFTTNDVERPHHVAPSMRSNDPCERGERAFGREQRPGESESAPTSTPTNTPADAWAVRPTAPQANGSAVEDLARATSGNLHSLATFECEWFVAKDKRRSRPWRHIEARRGPPGLR